MGIQRGNIYGVINIILPSCADYEIIHALYCTKYANVGVNWNTNRMVCTNVLGSPENCAGTIIIG